MHHIILCGGSGVRLWPLSRESKPKQFIDLVHETTLLQRTARCNQPATSGCTIVCNQEHAHLADQQLNAVAVHPRFSLLEPIGRNSAPAVCLALLTLDPEAVAFITPADLYIDYSESYFAALKEAEMLAKENHIVVFGIRPQSPETGYGYIEAGSDQSVKRFHEKPTLEVAQEYLKQGNFFWNSGMLCTKAGVLLQAMEKYAPEVLTAVKRTHERATVLHKGDSSLLTFSREWMEQIPAISLDYALLEKMTDLKLVIGDFEWSDVGSFDSLFIQLTKDEKGNAGKAHHLSVGSTDNLVMGNQRLIATIEVENLVVVDTPDALLIAKRGSTQKVREVVNQLGASHAHLKKTHVEETRPWGGFTVLESFDNWKVKRLTVEPGKRLSLQKHQHRSEHWVVVAGHALVTIGNAEQLLYPNQSVFIPLGELHRIENPGEELLVIIEVQCGAYTGEDDIVRYQDDFSRPVEVLK